MSANIAGGKGKARLPTPGAGADIPLFDEHDLPILDSNNEATIGQLLHKFKFHHIDATADGSNVEEFWPDKVLERILSRDRIIRDLKRKRGVFAGMQHWRGSECETLVRKQWSISVPYFRLDRRGKAVHREFHGSTMLPWRRVEPKDRLTWNADNRDEGGYAIVQGVMMARSSYNFDPVLKHLKLYPNGFALKKIKTSPKDVLDPKLIKLYAMEVGMLKQFSDPSQPHLIFLLSSFTWKNDLCFLFPHADCELSAYWEFVQKEPLPELEYRKWISRQLCGITNAVRTLHAGSVATEIYNDGKKRYCRHGDIRPENILWFRSDVDRYGILVLSDMGVSTFNRTVSRSKQPKSYVAQIPGYHPPEAVMAGGEVDRTFDIWSLGCIYLEMMAWALGGCRYVLEFKDARINEPATHVKSDVFYKIGIIDSRGDQVCMANLKDSVVMHEYCTPFISSVLNTIEGKMLVERRLLYPQGTSSNVYKNVTQAGVEVDMAPDIRPWVFKSTLSTAQLENEEGHDEEQHKEELDEAVGYDSDIADNEIESTFPPVQEHDEEHREEEHDEEMEFDNDKSYNSDVASVASSIFSGLSVMSSNSSQSNSDQIAIQALADLFQQDVVLVSILPRAISAVGPDRFERNVAKLLARYSRNLRKEASPGPQFQTSSFVGRYRSRVANLIRIRMSTVNDRRPITTELDTRTDDRARLNEWIALQLKPDHDSAVPATPVDIPSEAVQNVEDIDNTEFDGNNSDDSQNSEGVSDSPLDALREVTEFLKSAQAMQTLRMEFRQWLKIGDECPEDSEHQELEQEQEGERDSEVLEGQEGQEVQEVQQSDPNAATQPEKPSERSDTVETPMPRPQATQRRRQPIGLFTYRPRNLACLLDDLLYMLPFREKLCSWMAPPVPAGKTRIWWRCKDCGESLYGDVRLANPDAVQDIRNRLQGSIQTDHQSQQQGQQDDRPLVKWISSWNWILNMRESISGALRRLFAPPPELPVYRTRSTAAPSDPRDNLYLLLCVDKGGIKSLHQELLRDIRDDVELFEFLRELYYSIRPRQRDWFTLRSLKTVSLVRFDMDANRYPVVYTDDNAYACRRRDSADCVCFPSKRRIESNEYKCTPVPKEKEPEVHPALLHEHLTHYFKRPHAFTEPQRYILDQVPKRVNGPLTAPPNNLAAGWGLYFEEGRSHRPVYIAVVTIFLVGNMLSLLSAINKKDYGQMAAAILPMAPLVIMVVRLQDKI
ncbi:FAD binding domain protein [Apiospora rasikravindrae]|uniref:FAD binding domain protein n=1 Tax=Apiospora rasikravindrae TaxID=990691 RepID=A0ABR1T7N7_9PEZI